MTQLFVASTHAYVFFFCDKGKVYVKKVYEIPLAPRTAKGRAIVNFVGMEPGEKVAAIVEVPKIEKGQVRRHAHQARADQEDRARRVRELPREGHHRRARSRRTTSSSRPRSPTARASSSSPRSWVSRSASPRSRCARWGARPWACKAIELDEGDVVVGMAVTEDERAPRARRLREAATASGRPRGVPRAEPRRQGHHPHRRERPQRPGRRRRASSKSGDEVMLVTDRGQTLRTRSTRSARPAATRRA